MLSKVGQYLLVRKVLASKRHGTPSTINRGLLSTSSATLSSGTLRYEWKITYDHCRREGRVLHKSLSKPYLYGKVVPRVSLYQRHRAIHGTCPGYERLQHPVATSDLLAGSEQWKPVCFRLSSWCL